MTKQIIGNERAVEVLATLCRDYRGTALRAVREGGEHVYVPANTDSPADMLDTLRNPEGMIQFESQRNYAHKEPCYASINEFLGGRNADGTEHRGYLLIDVVDKSVVDFADRNGRSVVPIIRPFDPQAAVRELSGR